MNINEALEGLCAYLIAVGYSEYVCSFNPLEIGGGRVYCHVDVVDADLSAAIDLFVGGRPVRREKLSAIADEMAALRRLGIVEAVGKSYIMRNLRLMKVAGNFLFVGSPGVDCPIYLGDDSIGLLTRLSIRRHARCLDMCAGPGVQTLAMCARAKSVVAVEVNPVAASVLSLNAMMNGYGDRVTVVCGELFQGLDGMEFDHIVANPPFIPLPVGMSYPFVGDGGEDGLRVIESIFAGLPLYMAVGGVTQIICALMGKDGKLVHIGKIEHMARVANVNVLLTTIVRIGIYYGSDMASGLALTAAGGDVVLGRDLRDMLLAHYEREGANEIISCYMHIVRGAGCVRIQELTGVAREGSMWFI